MDSISDLAPSFHQFDDDHFRSEALAPTQIITRRRIGMEEMRSLLAKRKRLLFYRCSFVDVVDFIAITFDKGMMFDGCHFLRVFNATSARFKQSLKFDKCVFHQSIILEGAMVDGSLNLSFCKIHYPEEARKPQYQQNIDRPDYEPPPPFRAAKLGGLVVEGHLYARCLKVYGSLDMGHLRVSGGVFMEGAQIGLGPFDGRLYMRQARIDGDFELSPYFDPNWVPPLSGTEKASLPRFKAQRTVIRGALSIGASHFRGRINLRGIKVKRCIHGITCHIEGRLLADCWRHPQVLAPKFTFRTEIGVDSKTERQSILLHDSHIAEAVWLQGIKTAGAINFENARIGGGLQLEMWPRHSAQTAIKSRYFTSSVGRDQRLDSLIVKNAHISANLQLDCAVLKGRIAGHNCTLGAAFLCRPRKFRIEKFKTKEVSEITLQPIIGANNEDKSLSLYGATIGSNIDFAGTLFKGGVRLRYTKIRGAIIGRPWRSDGDSPKTTCMPEHEGRITTVPTRFSRSKNEAHSLYLYGAEIGGNVCCQGSRFDGIFSLELAKVQGSVELMRSKFSHSFLQEEKEQRIAESLILRRAYIENNVNISGCVQLGPIAGFGCRIGGEFTLDKIKQGRWNSHQCTMPALDLTGGEISAGLSSIEAEISGDFVMQGLKSSGSICLSASQIHGALLLDDADIGRNLDISRNEREKTYIRSHFSAQRAVVRGDLLAASFEFGLAASIDATPPPISSDSQPCLDLQQATVDGHMHGGTPSLRSTSRPLPSFERHIYGTMNGDGLKLGGNCDLRYWNIHGDLLISDAELRGALSLEHAVIDGAITITGSRLHGEAFCTSLHSEHPREASHATARDLSKPGAALAFFCPNAKGIVDLTDSHISSLHLSIPDSEQLAKGGSASQGVTAETTQRPNESTRAQTSGAPLEIVLSNVTAGTLKISGAMPPAQAPALTLGGLRFEHLNLDSFSEIKSAQIPPPLKWRRWNFPKHLDKDSRLKWAGLNQTPWWAWAMSSIGVVCAILCMTHLSKWLENLLPAEFGPMELVVSLLCVSLGRPFFLLLRAFWPDLQYWKREIGCHNRIRRPMGLLAQMKRFDRSAFSGLEQWLDNRGDRELADDVHHQMRQEELLLPATQLPLGRWIVKWLYFALAGSGTRIKRLVFVHVLLFLFSMLVVFKQPESVEHPPSFMMPSKIQGTTRTIEHREWLDDGGQPAADDWGKNASFWVSLNVHVPLVHFWARDEWEPASRKWKEVSAHTHLPLMRYDTYAGIVQAFGYLTLPMLITAITRTYKRRDA